MKITQVNNRNFVAFFFCSVDFEASKREKIVPEWKMSECTKFFFVFIAAGMVVVHHRAVD